MGEEAYKKKVILVTGSNGQLGNEMRQVSVMSANQYLFTDVAELDITDLEAVRRMMRDNHVDVVVNCAAYTNVDKAEDDEAAARRINRDAVENLALSCKENGATLIHVSTDYVFPGNGCIPCTEDMPVNPLGVYGKTKLEGEEAIHETGCKALIFRTAWLYSEYGNNFVKTMRRLTKERDTLNVVFDQVGTPTYAYDLAEAICEIIELEQYKGNEGIYHYSNEGVCSWFDFAKEIAALSGNECDIRPCHSDEFPSKVKRPHYSVLDKTKVKKTFALTIPYWKDSLKDCIDRMKFEDQVYQFFDTLKATKE